MKQCPGCGSFCDSRLPYCGGSSCHRTGVRVNNGPYVDPFVRTQTAIALGPVIHVHVHAHARAFVAPRPLCAWCRRNPIDMSFGGNSSFCSRGCAEMFFNHR